MEREKSMKKYPHISMSRDEMFDQIMKQIEKEGVLDDFLSGNDGLHEDDCWKSVSSNDDYWHIDENGKLYCCDYKQHKNNKDTFVLNTYFTVEPEDDDFDYDTEDKCLRVGYRSCNDDEFLMIKCEQDIELLNEGISDFYSRLASDVGLSVTENLDNISRVFDDHIELVCHALPRGYYDWTTDGYKIDVPFDKDDPDRSFLDNLQKCVEGFDKQAYIKKCESDYLSAYKLEPEVPDKTKEYIREDADNVESCLEDTLSEVQKEYEHYYEGEEVRE